MLERFVPRCCKSNTLEAEIHRLDSSIEPPDVLWEVLIINQQLLERDCFLAQEAKYFVCRYDGTSCILSSVERTCWLFPVKRHCRIGSIMCISILRNRAVKGVAKEATQAGQIEFSRIEDE